jgi:lipopolysaccharide/colanic/teichoic acid biosynthesis glycosyltransferase
VYRKYGKRLFDIVVSLLGLVFLLPIFMIISILIYLNMGRPILFVQQRPGLNGIPFSMFKFRTMKEKSSEDVNQNSDELRLTRLGRFLRSTSLDELPELWLVLKGEMSLVGPRPLLMEYIPYYSERQNKRHMVRPGLTGLAQVNGRNSLPWKDKLEFDVQYVETISFVLDIIILVKTVFKVLQRKDVNYNDQVGPEPFRGTDKE